MTEMAGAGNSKTESALRGTGVVLRDPLPWPQLLQVVQTAEDTGYQAVFVPEITGREAFASLAGMAPATSRLRLGTGVVTVWSRGPVVTAMAAATIQEASGGRMILGIGSGYPPGPEAHRRIAAAGGSIPLMREYIRVVRAVLSGESMASEGPFEVPSFALTLVSAGPQPQVWLAALGDRMLALAGEIADGVIMNWCTPERVREAREIVGEAASGAGRDPSEVAISVYVRACLGVDQPVALEALHEAIGMYAAIPHYLSAFRRMGLGEEAEDAAQAFGSGRPKDVPESLVRALSVSGGRAEARSRFDQYMEAGADLVLCYPVAALEPFSSILGTVLTAAPSPAVER